MLFFSVLFMSIAGTSDTIVCVWCLNLHSINIFSNETSLIPHTMQGCLLLSPSTLLIPRMFHIFYPSPAFQCPFQYPYSFSPTYLFWGIFGCVVGSWMWNVTVADVCSLANEELGLFCVTVSRWPSIRYAPQAAGTSGQWLWRLYVVCGCVLYRAILGLLELKVDYQSEWK